MLSFALWNRLNMREGSKRAVVVQVIVGLGGTLQHGLFVLRALVISGEYTLNGVASCQHRDGCNENHYLLHSGGSFLFGNNTTFAGNFG